jgi:hypothetical protein
LFAQSLADVAKKEKERRKKSEKPAEVYVITEYDLSKARGSGGDVESTVTTGSDDDKEDGRPSLPRSGPASSLGSTRSTSSSSYSKCDSIRQSLTRVQRRYNEGVTVTERVPARTARHVRTGIDSQGNPIYSDTRTYENRTRKVSCSTAEGRKNTSCQGLAQEMDSLRQKLRTCHLE